MPVPTIPSAISASSIQTEFGGSNPISLSEYYSGGSNVPAGTANATSVLIPSSPGTLRFSNFSGAQKIVSASISLTVGDSLDFNGAGEVGYQFGTGGFGSVNTRTLIGSRTLFSVVDGYSKGVTYFYTMLTVVGDQRSSWYSYWQYTGDSFGTKTFYRTSASNVYYDSGTNVTSWLWSSGGPTFDTSGTFTIYS